ncbi:hypothetical protein P5673_001849 [Acropora cervicornis]|uniref:Uncharacterized protein n=1 Tax=Acropora cervicornis TaxID=6130 RepID=A0AAD9R4A1_ACRCE|nr:hypothetical protein P5673_001849 [Acropora cervicornis]
MQPLHKARLTIFGFSSTNPSPSAIYFEKSEEEFKTEFGKTVYACGQPRVRTPSTVPATF